MVDSSIDAEAAAFVYLMAQTEAILEYDQNTWVYSDPDCGTSACLAGHAAVYEKDSLDGAIEKADAWRIQKTALDVLLDTEKASEQEISELKGVFLICDVERGHTIESGLSENVTAYESIEEQALDAFKNWVHRWGDSETVEKFENLIEDVDKLKRVVA